MGKAEANLTATRAWALAGIIRLRPKRSTAGVASAQTLAPALHPSDESTTWSFLAYRPMQRPLPHKQSTATVAISAPTPTLQNVAFRTGIGSKLIWSAKRPSNGSQPGQRIAAFRQIAPIALELMHHVLPRHPVAPGHPGR